MPTLRLQALEKTYKGAVDVHALVNATVTVQQGEYLAIEGPSGSGKSTLLNQIALLDSPTGGEYLIDETNTATLNDVQRARLRSATFAFIFQSFHLLDGRNVLDNVSLGTLYRGLPIRRRQELALKALGFVGLEHKADQDVATLSGGERQRVAIARAIASGAPVLVADEPTGNLDQANGQQVMDTLEALNAQGITVIIVTHDSTVADRAQRRLHVLDGIVSEKDTGGQQSTTSTHNTNAVEAAQTAPKPPEGRNSRVRTRDALADAWKGLWAKPARTIALVASVALGVGLALTTTGLAQTARYQVSDIFDAQRNQRVGMLSQISADAAGSSQAISVESLERVRTLAGVEDVLITATHGQHAISANPGFDANSHQTPPYDVVGIIDGYLPGNILTIDTGNGMTGSRQEPDNFTASSENPQSGTPLPSLQDGQVLVGSQIAQDLNLGPLLASPVIWIDGQPQQVVGVITDAGLQLSLLRAVVVPETTAQRLSPARYYGAEIKVVPGAAPQVAEQAPLAWIPAAPETVQVDAPPDPTTLRETIESNLQTMLLTLTGVALLAAVLSMTNSMTTAVFQRIGEFGLRRAIGARRIHIVSLVMSESLAIGVLGGIIGIYGAIMVILGVTLARQWQPVLDPVMLPLGLIGGIAVGLIGGIVATQRAARIEPSDALRA